MTELAERTVQDALVDRLTKPDLGWTFVPGADLAREPDQVLVEQAVVAGLVKLNPAIAEDQGRANEILPKLRAAILSVGDDGLLATNERMVSWLRGHQTHKYVGTTDFVPVRLIDFDNPRANDLIVATEVTYRGLDERRYDLVLYVNGFPLVVGETKTPISHERSWLNGTRDIHVGYEGKTPGFFVPNVLSFATEGKELRYGAIRQPPQD